MTVKNKSKMKNLVQYRNMSDEEFDSVWENYSLQPSEDVESRTQKIMDDLTANYDLSNLNVNDALGLHEFSRIQVLLDDLNIMEISAIADGEIAKLTALSKIRDTYLSNQSKLANDLNITRRSRQSEVEALETYLPGILKKAKNFYERRLAFVYCPECKMLVMNAWFTDWSGENKLNLTCPRPECGYKFMVRSSDLQDGKNTNIQGVLHV